MPSKFVPNAEDVDRQLESEFLEDVKDTVSQLDIQLANLRANKNLLDEGLAPVRQLVHNLMAQGRGVNMPTIHLLVHRLNEYLTEVKALDDTHVDNIQTFVDKINGVLDGDIDPAGIDATPKLVRELPKKVFADIDFGDITPQDVEVLLVIPERSMARIVEQEMAACGYRTSNAKTSYEAFNLAIQTKPDLIVASMELGDLRGVDLACAFAAMQPTHALPFCLLTSYEWGNPALDRLPLRAALLRKGPAFGSDLAEALARFRIT
ncbi:response regulator [Varunaivibrio sulfuroxidans]|uniref:Response regulator receiver domain-containing protein n=1 Tax=Varunaivibrio sulfuroxidans TaxID=1773489 RepID=A0A4R3J9H0_9PROT|nr:DNA-binding response regulator [Varunaivibrio sulfuroxidans]TCS62157.1 hypothetical protein EDD55_106115 [Varunaivibrio sulfuroxidans]WES30586.1 DNA-binding response regulator [Varunaivibrio sulfuroxidans]